MRYAGELLFVVLILVILGAAGVYAFGMLGNSLERRRGERQLAADQEHQRQLALVAPAAARGDPLLPIVISQGKELQSADALFAKLLRSDIEVLMPTEMSEQIQAWQAKHQDGVS